MCPDSLRAASIDNIFKQKIVDFQKALTRSDIRVLLALIFVGVFQTVIVLKHFGIHYLMPALPIAFLGVVWLVQFVGNKWRVISVILLGFSCYTIVNSSAIMLATLKESRLTIDEAREPIKIELEKYNTVENA